MRPAFRSSRPAREQVSPFITWMAPTKYPRPSERDWIASKPRTINQFSELIGALVKAKSMLNLPDDWDDAGSPSIRPETLKRVSVFLVLNAALIWVRFTAMIPTPRITPGPEGSIDLHWRTQRRELLISIPQDLQEPCPYYGDDYGADKRKGTIPANAIDMELFAWLTIMD
jgi:hypothetical protein